MCKQPTAQQPQPQGNGFWKGVTVPRNEEVRELKEPPDPQFPPQESMQLDESTE